MHFSKSSLFFSKNVSAEMKGIIKRIAGMKILAKIGKYLGFPFVEDRRPRNKINYIVDRVKSKLAGWKTNCLSMAGKVILAKFVLSAIPLYPMQVAKVPVSVCNGIEKIQKKFI